VLSLLILTETVRDRVAALGLACGALAGPLAYLATPQWSVLLGGIGGGNFGIVTELRFRLHPVGPIVLAGWVLHPQEKAAEVLRFTATTRRQRPMSLPRSPSCAGCRTCRRCRPSCAACRSSPPPPATAA
jgi:hypothetical protein